MIPGNRAGRRDETRPERGFLGLVRDKTRPAHHKSSISGHFEPAGRTISRMEHSDVARLKPMTPLQPLMQASVKPPSPLRAPQQQPLKPTTPMQPKNARNTPISHPQRRRRFQLKLDLREQRRQQFQTTTHLARGLQLRHQRHPCARLSENSHAIRLGEVSIKSENVAIPTL